jgi:hypothetical protein
LTHNYPLSFQARRSRASPICSILGFNSGRKFGAIETTGERNGTCDGFLQVHRIRNPIGCEAL